MVVKTGLFNLYRPSTGFAVFKMYLLNIYKHTTGSALVKMCMTILKGL